jgi:vacuolar iron transporter family protein
LFAIGAGTSLFTGRNVLFSGLRQLLIGFAAAGVTFLIGRLVGASLAG